MRPLLLLPLALWLAACASTQSIESSVELGPAGRAVGRFAVPAGARIELDLENRGPGDVDFVVRHDGEALQRGPLGTSHAFVESSAPTTLEVVLEARADGGATVAWVAAATDGLSARWDTSEAFPAGR